MALENEGDCRVELFGSVRLIRQGRTTSRFRLQKASTLLAYLALNPGRPHSRERLIDLFWPERDQDAGRDNLSTILSVLRRELEPPGVPPSSVLLADRQTICLVTERVTTDFAEFEAWLRKAGNASAGAERASLLGQAVALYRGDLLEDCYDPWALTAQAACRERYLEALLILAQDLETLEDWEKARAAAERALLTDPVCEAGALILMRVLARLGLAARALQTYRLLEQRLREEWGAAPAPELAALAKSIVKDSEKTPAYTAESPTAQITVTSLVSQFEIEPVGGAVPLNSPYYIVRAADAVFQTAMKRRDSIVLVKGPHQTGKSSLLARGMQEARKSGAASVLTDLQTLNPPDWQSAERFYRALAQNILDQLEIEVALESVWSASRSANANFERFLQREVIGQLSQPLVWGLDEVDLMFRAPFSNDVFALFRSWHNARAFDPDTHWHKLTLAISYATEAHLFISDLNCSPFNVGTRVTLEDFTDEETAELNRRHGAPLNSAELAEFIALVGGNPFLVRRGLYEIVTRGLDLAAFMAQAKREEGCYGDHLTRLLANLKQDPALTAAVQELLHGQAEPASASFYRLQSAGVVTRGKDAAVELRCRLYRSYLANHLV